MSSTIRRLQSSAKIPNKLQSSSGGNATTTSGDRDRNIFSNSVTLAQYSLVLQLLLRAITFGLNGLAYRHLDAGLLGIVNFRLGLYYSTVVFAARESFRRACMSRGGELLSGVSFVLLSSVGREFIAERKRLWHSLLNVMWLTIPVGILVVFLLLPVWLFIWPSPSLDPSVTSNMLPQVLHHQYLVCTLVYSASALLELVTEPLWLVTQLGLFVRSRIILEAVANIVRAAGVVLSVCYLPKSYGLYLLAGPQLLHGASLLLGYTMFFAWLLIVRRQLLNASFLPLESYRDLLPSFKVSLDRPCLHLSWSFFRQGMLKQFLTEGERYLISAFHLLNFADQGIYDLVNNLGSVVPRLLFNPVEESCHLLFSQCIQRDLPANRQNENLLLQAFKMLGAGLRLTTLTAWLGFTFSHAYARLLFLIYGGAALANHQSAVILLRVFSFYLVFLAWNGPTEAFINASMTTEQLNRHNHRLTVFSLIFLGTTWLLVPVFDAAGFILANCINLLIRIIYSCYFISRFLNEAHSDLEARSNEKYSPATLNELRNFSVWSLLLPTKTEAAFLTLALVATMTSEGNFCTTTFNTITVASHVGCGIFFLGLVIAVILQQEHGMLSMLRRGLFKR